MAFYGGTRAQIVLILSSIPTEDDITMLVKELENIQPRCAARKALHENQFELERLLSKTGELKHKDRQQIANLREKARTLREAYQRLSNDRVADHNIIINTDSARAARIVKAYRDGYLSEPELFRVMQLDLMEMDKETFQYETRVQDLIDKYTRQIELLKKQPATTAAITNVSTIASSTPALQELGITTNNTRYPFRQTSELSELHAIMRDIQSRLSETELELETLQNRRSALTDNDDNVMQELDAQISLVYKRYDKLTQEYSSINSRIELLTNMCYQSHNSDSDLQHISNDNNIVLRAANEQLSQTKTQIQGNQPRPPSTVPSDDEFIENIIGDNLCTKQLQDMIKPIAVQSPTQIGQDNSSSSTNTKSTKRRSSKYDAQMRYQTSRIT
jgi:hypothetical protein